MQSANGVSYPVLQAERSEFLLACDGNFTITLAIYLNFSNLGTRVPKSATSSYGVISARCRIFKPFLLTKIREKIACFNLTKTRA